MSPYGITGPQWVKYPKSPTCTVLQQLLPDGILGKVSLVANNKQVVFCTWQGYIHSSGIQEILNRNIPLCTRQENQSIWESNSCFWATKEKTVRLSALTFWSGNEVQHIITLWFIYVPNMRPINQIGMEPWNKHEAVTDKQTDRQSPGYRAACHS